METEQQDSLANSLKTVLLVVIESFISMVLRFDDELRKTAYPLASSSSVIAIRSYLPHDEIYLTFSFKGVLIDSELPEHKERPDIIVNAHSFEIINAVVSDKGSVVDKLQYRGDSEQVEHFKAFLQQLSLNGLFNNLLSRFNAKKPNKTDAKNSENSDANSSENNTKDDVKKIDPKQKISQLKSDLNESKILNKKLSTQVAENQSKEKLLFMLSFAMLIIGVILGGVLF